MAIFYNNGYGEIYGGASKVEILRAMHEDGLNIEEEYMVEISGSTNINTLDIDKCPTDELSTLNQEFIDGIGAYCVASNKY